MEVVQVQPRDSYLHNIYVSAKGTVIKWSFTTKKNRISFGIFRRKEKEPLPNSSDILFRARSQSKKRQMSLINDFYKKNGNEDDENESGNVMSNRSQSNNRPRSKSVATLKLKEGGLEEIIPIQNFHSSAQKIEGTYTVAEPGNYVLVFDNTSSRTTPKILTYTVALGNKDDVDMAKNEVSGWLLKKKRKRMQGWAKRWFTLSPSGVLSYSTSQHSVTRGSIQILVSTISYITNLRQINIDSGTMIYHLKTLTEDEHTRWQNALTDVRRQKGDIMGSALLYDEYNKSSTSLANSKRLLPRTQENKKIKAEIEQGLATATTHQQHIDGLSDTIHLLKDRLMANDLKAIQSVIEKLDFYKLKLDTDAKEQQTQWKNLQQYFLNLVHHRSGSLSPMLQTEDDIHEETSHRASSSYSRLSTFSDQFFDAEDIELSGDEEDAFDHTLIIDESSSSEESESERGSSSMLDLNSMIQCDRRTSLPSPAVADAESALNIIRKNIGKDLSTISMPISMNEPLNMLQRACEELEYSELLQKASTLEDSIERLMYVTVFSVSSYASTQYRTGRKPFNPMMTETYENIRPDKGFRFIAEKVSHSPLIVAAYAEARQFKYWQSTNIKSKFWGKSMEFMTEGTFHVTLTGHDDHFTFFKPSSWMKNMIAGEKYLEHSGDCKVVNRTTGEYATVVFKEGTGGGLFGAPTKRNDVIATIYDAHGNKKRRVVGKWSESLAEEMNMDKRKLSVLWTCHTPGIPQYEKYFGFTKFAIELNELTELEEGKLPITDTRFRPDQQLYEKGFIEEADNEKVRIEQKQREKRKELELAGKEWKPKWFVREGDEWVFNGQYWLARESGQWPKDQFELW